MTKISNKKQDSGEIVTFFSGVARIKGLPKVFLYEELLNKKGKAVAFVIGFDENFVEALFFNENFDSSQCV